MIPGEGAVESVGQSHRFADEAEGRRIKGGHGEVGQARLAPGEHGKHGNLLHAVTGRGARGRLPRVPVAVGDEDDAKEPRMAVEQSIEHSAEIGAGFGARFRRSEGFVDDLELPGERSPRLGSDEFQGKALARTGCARRVALGGDVLRLHAARGIAKDREDGLLIGLVALTPFRLVQGHGDDGDDEEPQELENTTRDRVVIPFPDQEGKHRRDEKHDKAEDHRRRSPGKGQFAV